MGHGIDARIEPVAIGLVGIEGEVLDGRDDSLGLRADDLLARHDSAQQRIL
ncbi:hypothetical protein D3C87_2144640 [compost metagenome]